jgi:hypothetical protein
MLLDGVRMRIDRLKLFADCVGGYSIDADGNEVEGEYAWKMHHKNWDYSLVRLGDISASECGELPTIFPKYWERFDLVAVRYREDISMDFWDALSEFFGIPESDL